MQLRHIYILRVLGFVLICLRNPAALGSTPSYPSPRTTLWCVSNLVFKMWCGRLSISNFHLTFLKFCVTRRYIVKFVPVVVLYKKHNACHCHSALLGRRFCSAADKRNNRAPTVSFAVCLLLLGAVFIPGAGILFYYRRERHKLLKKYEDKHLFQMPFVDTKAGLLFQHNGSWFPVVMFPSLQRFEQIRNFTLKDDDILIVSFPKSGKSYLHILKFN